MENYKLLNGVALAFVGDSYYDLMIRKYLLDKGYTKVNDLHKKATKYVSAAAQASVINELIVRNFLTSNEIEVVNRGRNAKTNHGRQNVDILTYKHSTSFEALIGYLYLTNELKRLDEIIGMSIKIIEGGN